ncbi:uncharacterized protein MONOS_57 [Monocercomonoides exilis]|uniref:uncharacterized protein n=1 Tax=Monocercomonoides exilis TaxID=2049356 RepID=UPI00355A8E9D|nr:hypothetical protein MONOS_57 [Monocercomonoides exilis]|eukprot:MONOS_57.1-p1 / transcript=MONOS_57.1 / gene=MONOS_57 / organism=Monocercomonoides_exilis_PA203 / gene_product=unspecified product / transcript_product=unspecified product / location=Mono_scaffold00001:304653-305713(+) / protein_length=270 / sequence_SO=supercontig / SO=protein_coding / is_pseudo=false
MKCSKNFCYAIMIKMKFCALYFSDDGKPSIFVYGGVDYKDDILSDAYVITLEPLFVTLIQIPLESKKPTVKFFAQFSFNNTLYIWGGCQDSRISNELWSYNFSSHEWKEMDQGDLIPEGRYSMAYATGDNRLYIFGGISANGLLNDLWEFDIQTKQWRALKIDSGANDPEPCSGAGMFISNEYAVVFGGDTDREEVYTIKMFRVKIDVISPQSWEEVKIANLDGSESIIPVSRSNFGHATRVISNETFLYLFGVKLDVTLKGGSLQPIRK